MQLTSGLRVWRHFLFPFHIVRSPANGRSTADHLFKRGRAQMLYGHSDDQKEAVFRATLRRYGRHADREAEYFVTASCAGEALPHNGIGRPDPIRALRTDSTRHSTAESCPEADGRKLLALPEVSLELRIQPRGEPHQRSFRSNWKRQ
jgi:hypothetical protein